jgi:hypothetical protein
MEAAYYFRLPSGPSAGLVPSQPKTPLEVVEMSPDPVENTDAGLADSSVRLYAFCDNYDREPRGLGLFANRSVVIEDNYYSLPDGGSAADDDDVVTDESHGGGGSSERSVCSVSSQSRPENHACVGPDGGNDVII